MLNSLEDVYGLFRQVERESLFDENYKRGYDEGYARGFEKGKLESKEEIILNMLEESFDIATIQRISGCSSKHFVLNSLEDVYELFRQVERESLFDEGYAAGYARGFEEGKLESKEETVVNMLEESFDVATIQRISGCSSKHIFEIQKRQFKDSKCLTDTIDNINLQ